MGVIVVFSLVDYSYAQTNHILDFVVFNRTDLSHSPDRMTIQLGDTITFPITNHYHTYANNVIIHDDYWYMFGGHGKNHTSTITPSRIGEYILYSGQAANFINLTVNGVNSTIPKIQYTSNQTVTMHYDQHEVNLTLSLVSTDKPNDRIWAEWSSNIMENCNEGEGYIIQLEIPGHETPKINNPPYPRTYWMPGFHPHCSEIYEREGRNNYSSYLSHKNHYKLPDEIKVTIHKSKYSINGTIPHSHYYMPKHFILEKITESNIQPVEHKHSNTTNNIQNNIRIDVTEIDTVKNEWINKFNQCKDDKNLIEIQFNTISSELNQTKTELSDLQTRYNTLESQYDILQSQHSTTLSTLSDLQSQYDILQNKADKLQNKADLKIERKDLWKERYNTCYDKKENFKTQLETTTQELNQYKLDIVDNENQCTQLLEDHETQITTLQGNLTNANFEIEKLKQEKADLIKQFEEVETELIDAQNRIKELES